MAPGEKGSEQSPAKNTLQKVRRATLVISLARGWQQWANENNTKQAGEPTGWLPGGTQDPPQVPTPVFHSATHQRVQSASVCPSPTTEGCGDGHSTEEAAGISQIKRKGVTRTVESKAYERGEGVGHLSHRFQKPEQDSATAQPQDEVDRILQSRGSPTRRRRCAHLVSELTRGWKEVEQEPQGRSDSLDTEDSGYGGDSEDRPEQDGEQGTVARIKRPLPTQASRFTERLHCKAQGKCSQVGSLRGRWQQWAEEHVQAQKLNPFSEDFDHQLAMSTRLHRGDAGYGHPREGTKTAERARRAEEHIHKEIQDLCFVIRTMAQLQHHGRPQVTFGELFDRYVRISDKVVGILLRARKHGLVDFEGEMLWQGRDDQVVITLLD